MSTIEARHAHGGGMSMSGMSMGLGVPSLFYMQSIFWAFVGSTIGVAILANIINKIICYQRITLSKANPAAAKPKGFFFQAQATISAMIREYSNYSLPISIRGRQFYLPTAGPLTLLVGYLVLIVGCGLYALNPDDLLEWEDLGYRTGFVAICQMPLIILLAGKRNIIGFATGVGYERLTWLHRWVARSLLFSVIFHLFFWFEEWNKYDYAATKIKADAITQKGLIAGGILLWIVVSSTAPIRGLSYEVFVVQHIISWLAFVVVVLMHVPAENKIWIYLPLAFWGFDRVVRLLYFVYNNLSIFHRNKKSALLSCKATFTPLDESHTRITIANPPISWTPGQHIFLSVPAIAPFTSHPFTIASLPTDNTMEFIVRAKKGATKRFFKYADKISLVLPSYSSTSSINKERMETRTVLIDGPYSRIRPLRQFDSVLFIAGSTGATFTVPLLRDLVQTWSMSSTSPKPSSSLKSRLSLQASTNSAVTRKIRFIWVLKNSDWTKWFSSQLEDVLRTVHDLQNKGIDIDLSISIHITSSCSPSALSSSPNEGVCGGETPLHTSTHHEEICPCKLTAVNSQAPIQRCICDPSLSSLSSNYASEKGYNNTIVSSSKSLSRSPKIGYRRGRPVLKDLIREEAEQARGEMAVVVCGPGGMVNSARNAACRVSDERGVHKGTGAQGIWVHGEGFGYA